LSYSFYLSSISTPPTHSLSPPLGESACTPSHRSQRRRRAAPPAVADALLLPPRLRRADATAVGEQLHPVLPRAPPRCAGAQALVPAGEAGRGAVRRRAPPCATISCCRRPAVDQSMRCSSTPGTPARGSGRRQRRGGMGSPLFGFPLPPSLVPLRRRGHLLSPNSTIAASCSPWLPRAAPLPPLPPALRRARAESQPASPPHPTADAVAVTRRVLLHFRRRSLDEQEATLLLRCGIPAPARACCPLPSARWPAGWLEKAAGSEVGPDGGCRSASWERARIRVNATRTGRTVRVPVPRCSDFDAKSILQVAFGTASSTPVRIDLPDA
jgi:hypothetical protein